MKRNGLLAGVLVAVVLGAISIWVLASDGESDVESAASGASGGQSAAEVVQDAIDATLATSWVATSTVEEAGLGIESTVTYQPSDPDAGHAQESMSLDMRFDGWGEAGDEILESIVLLPPDGSSPITCAEATDGDCDESGWVRVDSLYGTPDGSPADRTQMREAMVGNHTLIGLVDANSAVRVDVDGGVYEAAVDSVDVLGVAETGACPSDACEARLTIEDALVTRVEMTYEYEGESTFVIEFGSFGEAPAIEIPPADQISELDDFTAGPATESEEFDGLTFTGPADGVTTTVVGSP